ncbi:hypothetical protein DS2_12699 [Catenovulum agarivorans DS-2]|uniref:Uncharacterized protein n=1 Tax=Catenovulum agarivorans DS-2 TaxID=1328313 RepID=W7Q9A8_9ALTE|nr:hypothetical protein DS2_12699 [Catenovulum agarivorans DS-2]
MPTSVNNAWKYAQIYMRSLIWRKLKNSITRNTVTNLTLTYPFSILISVGFEIDKRVETSTNDNFIPVRLAIKVKFKLLL